MFEMIVLRSMFFPYFLISHHVQEEVLSLPAPLFLSNLDRGTPMSISNCTDNVDSSIQNFPLHKS